jgi:Carbohydrate phosphorylase
MAKRIPASIRALSALIEGQARIEALYWDQEKWSEKSILNIARSGKFSSDRTIVEYAYDIWNVKPVDVRPRRVLATLASPRSDPAMNAFMTMYTAT